MGQIRTIQVQVTCDWDSKVIDGQPHRRFLSLDDRRRRVDLCGAHSRELDQVAEKLMQAARPMRDKASRERSHAIRAWAVSEGLQVKDHGRLPWDVITKYDAANS